MSIAGRKRTPAAIRKLEGNRSKRPIPNEPKIEKGIPACHPMLSGAARHEWERLVPALNNMGVLDKTVDRAALTIYCDLWGELVEVNREIRKIPYLASASTGKSQVNPLYNLKMKLVDEIRKYLGEFGMTAVSRSRLAVGKDPAEHDALDDILNAQRQN